MVDGVERSRTLEQARAALASDDWEAARDLYARALEVEAAGEALDGLGQALWWLGEEERAVELRARAFSAYQREGDAAAAANVAAFLAAEYRIAGNASLANGWLGRGSRALEGCEECAAHVWLCIERSKRTSDPAQAEREARAALAIARRLGDSALESAALSHAGRALISLGERREGLALLDEALTIATSVESDDPMAIGDACCTTLTACESLADPRRALDWGRAISEFFQRRRFLPLLSWCRTVYAGFLISTGRWSEAEKVLEEALELEASLPNPNRAGSLVLLGDLRLRQGRLEVAGRLLAGFEDRPGALHPAVRLHIARGELGLAAEKVESALAAEDDPSPELLSLRAEVEIARSDARAASEAAGAAALAAAGAGREDLIAGAGVLEARAARLAGAPANRAALEAAIERFSELGMIFEEAGARIELAHALAAERPHSAVEQGRVALRAFESLGAGRRADEAAEVLRSLGAPGRPAPRTGSELTRREQQVLELLGEGLSNPQIAERLVISPRTAEHHVGRILRKLELRNRAEAAAYAVRHGPPALD